MKISGKNALNTPQKKSLGSKVYVKVVLKKENANKDGFAPEYIQIFLNKCENGI